MNKNDRRVAENGRLHTRTRTSRRCYYIGVHRDLSPRRTRQCLERNKILEFKILTASLSVINKGRRKNAPARESRPGYLVYENSALTIQPREHAWLDRHQIRKRAVHIKYPHHMLPIVARDYTRMYMVYIVPE